MINKFHQCYGAFYSRSLHRQLLEEKIAQYADYIKGKTLDVGSRNRRYDEFFIKASEICAIDINPNAQKNVKYGNVQSLPFDDAIFDSVVSFEVFEYVPNIEQGLKEISRVLKKDGIFLLSCPFLNPVHGDVDEMRYTFKAWKRFLDEDFDIDRIESFGGRNALLFDTVFEKVRNYYGKWRKLALWPFLILLKKICHLIDDKEKNWRYPLGYFIICRSKK